MMAAAQPFISGAISKTINMPNEATVEDVKKAYVASWQLDAQGERALPRRQEALPAAVERRRPSDLDAADAVAEAGIAGCGRGEQVRPRSPRRSSPATSPSAAGCPDRRAGYTQKAVIGGHKVYLRTGEYDDGTLGEIFIDMHKEGAAFRSLMNCFAIADLARPAARRAARGVRRRVRVHALRAERHRRRATTASRCRRRSSTTSSASWRSRTSTDGPRAGDRGGPPPDAVRSDTTNAEYEGEEVVAERQVPLEPAPRPKALQPEAIHPARRHGVDQRRGTATANAQRQRRNGNGNGHGFAHPHAVAAASPEKGYALAGRGVPRGLPGRRRLAKSDPVGAINRVAVRSPSPAARARRDPAGLHGRRLRQLRPLDARPQRHLPQVHDLRRDERLLVVGGHQ